MPLYSCKCLHIALCEGFFLSNIWVRLYFWSKKSFIYVYILLLIYWQIIYYIQYKYICTMIYQLVIDVIKDYL